MEWQHTWYIEFLLLFYKKRKTPFQETESWFWRMWYKDVVVIAKHWTVKSLILTPFFSYCFSRFCHVWKKCLLFCFPHAVFSTKIKTEGTSGNSDTVICDRLEKPCRHQGHRPGKRMYLISTRAPDSDPRHWIWEPCLGLVSLTQPTAA